MNIENLQKMADYIKTIPQEYFDMYVYRTVKDLSPVCQSVGCIIGHCTALDAENVRDNFTYPMNIAFRIWSEEFTGIDSFSDLWDFCFGAHWVPTDNTVSGAAKRLELVINGTVNQHNATKFSSPNLYHTLIKSLDK